MSQWKAFQIKNLFIVKNTHSILKTSINENSGNNPYVTASNVNNGIFTYIDYDRSQIEKGNAIMIGGKTLTFTFQQYDFYSNDSHNLALYLKNEKYRTEFIQMFLISALKASIGNKYSWGDSISYKSIQNDFVYLPVNKTSSPDYNYMESYIKEVEMESRKRLNLLQTI